MSRNGNRPYPPPRNSGAGTGGNDDIPTVNAVPFDGTELALSSPGQGQGLGQLSPTDQVAIIVINVYPIATLVATHLWIGIVKTRFSYSS